MSGKIRGGEGLFLVDTPKIITHVSGVRLCAGLCLKAWSCSPGHGRASAVAKVNSRPSLLKIACLSWPCGFQDSDQSLVLYICFPPRFRSTCHPRVVLVGTLVNEALCPRKGTCVSSAAVCRGPGKRPSGSEREQLQWVVTGSITKTVGARFEPQGLAPSEPVSLPTVQNPGGSL